MTGQLHQGAIPCTRAVDPRLRRARLVAARAYARGSVPRVAILIGLWDGGSVVGAAQHDGASA